MTRVPKGWGFELWIWNEAYCGKLLHFYKGKRCSYHYHKEKDEVFYLHAGRIRLLYGADDDYGAARELVLEPGMRFHVSPGLRHQMIALEESDLYEFSTHHRDEDSYRVVRGD